MAWIFSLSAECGRDRLAAETLGRYFDCVPLPVHDGPAHTIDAAIHQDREGSWWMVAIPRGVSQSGIRYEADARLMTAIAGLLYERLRTAPPFRYAIVGVEVDEFRCYGELDDDILALAFDGLVINDALWEQFHRSALFVPFAPGYYWRPYRGEHSAH